MTLEEQYINETGIDLYVMDGPNKIYNIHEYFDYAAWLETRLTLALSRIEAAEKVIERFMRESDNVTINNFQVSMQNGSEYSQWCRTTLCDEPPIKDSIRAMEGTK